MTSSTQPSPTAGSGVDASALSRRELQYFARELELCRGNAKSDVIVEHLVAFMASSAGAARVATLMDAMPEEYKTRTPGAKTATPARKTSRETPREEVTPQALSFTDDATPSRRSTRKSSRSETSADSAEATSAPPSRSPTPPLGRKMDFDDDPKQAESTVAMLQPSQTEGVDAKQGTESKDTPTSKEALKEEVKKMSKKESTPVKKDSTPMEKEPTPVKKKSTPAKIESMPASEEKLLAKKDMAITKKEKTPTKATAVTSEAPSAELKVSTKTPPRRLTPVKTGRSPLANVSNVTTKRSSQSAPATVEELLDSVGDLIAVTSDRVKCTTTGHEMKADFDVISAYIAGKRYQRAHKQKVSFTKFAPMFVDHSDEKQSHLVWCSVTQSAIARSVERIEAHMNGARYQKELPSWQAEQAALAVAKEVEQKEQAAQKEARASATHSAPTKKTQTAKRKASGAIPAEAERRVKVPRSEAK